VGRRAEGISKGSKPRAELGNREHLESGRDRSGILTFDIGIPLSLVELSDRHLPAEVRRCEVTDIELDQSSRSALYVNSAECMSAI
jgi:hypothetical protein